MPATLLQAMASSAPVSTNSTATKTRNGVRIGPGTRLVGRSAAVWRGLAVGLAALNCVISVFELRRRRRARDAGPQPPDADVPDTADVGELGGGGQAAGLGHHRHRHEQVRARQRHALEAGLGDPDHGELAVVETQRPVAARWDRRRGDGSRSGG